jgi:predicted metal-dependent phosphotriesterase family hydrolase
MPRYIETVRGRVPADTVGFTLPHEHTYIKLWELESRHDYAGLLPLEDLLVEELSEFASRGGDCVVDLTLPGIGRDPLAVRRLSERTDLHFVVGTGFYRQPYYPPDAHIDERSVNSIAEEMIREFEEGIGGTGIKPGIIGEIGANKSWISAQEERVHRAAARAHKVTGLAITTHTNVTVGLEQLALLDEEGVDLERVIIGHCDWYPSLDYYMGIIETGACVEFDVFGHLDPTTHGLEPMVLELLFELLDRGKERHILLSQDVCFNANLKRFGGHGYSYLQETILPKLREAGVSDELVRTMTVENPTRLLAFEADGQPAPTGGE